MSLFRQPRPRRFHHEYIYVDERKERLKQIEQKAREELGMTPHKALDREKIHQAFLEAMPHTKRKRQRRGVAFPLLQLVLLMLLLVLFCLILIFIL